MKEKKIIDKIYCMVNLNEMANEYANSVIYDSGNHEDAVQEVVDNFGYGFNYLYESFIPNVEKLFDEDFSFPDGTSEDAKNIVLESLETDAKVGLLMALLDDLEVDLTLEDVLEKMELHVDDDNYDENEVEVKVVNMSEHDIPKYATEHASGFDFQANVAKPLTLKPMERMIVPTGLFFEVPVGYELQVRPRSGLAIKNGITVLNTPGTVDADYRGEVGVIIVNLSDNEFTINPGDRIAQGVIAPVTHVNIVGTEKLSSTERGDGGFGHTGK